MADFEAMSFSAMTAPLENIGNKYGSKSMSPIKPDQIWFTRVEATKYLESIGSPVSARTLEQKAANKNAGDGPAFTRVSWKIVRYHKADLDAWAKRRSVRIE